MFCVSGVPRSVHVVGYSEDIGWCGGGRDPMELGACRRDFEEGRTSKMDLQEFTSF